MLEHVPAPSSKGPTKRGGRRPPAFVDRLAGVQASKHQASISKQLGNQGMRLWGYEAMRLWGHEAMRLWGYEAIKLLRYQASKLFFLRISQRFSYDLRQTWHSFGTMLVPFSNKFRENLKQFWDICETMFGTLLTQCWDCLGTGTNPGQHWCIFLTILEPCCASLW